MLKLCTYVLYIMYHVHVSLPLNFNEQVYYNSSRSILDALDYCVVEVPS